MGLIVKFYIKKKIVATKILGKKSVVNKKQGPLISSQFVCVEVLWPSQPIGVMLSMVSYLTTLLLGRLSPLRG